MQNNINKSIINTLCYADIFDYPLKLEEIWRYFISKDKVSKVTLRNVLEKRQYLIEKEENYFFLSGKNFNIKEREKRSEYSKIKLIKAQKIIRWLSLIPTIRLIGISGSLTMNNAKKDDDIDVFIITRENTMWLTRFFVNIVLYLTRSKRKRLENNTRDKICPNMFVSSSNLYINEQNLFTAHEIVQLKVLLNKNNTHERFLSANSWIKNYLPNAVNFEKLKIIPNKKTLLGNFMNFYLSKLDMFFYIIQLSYMKKHKTTEKIEKEIAKFHPYDKKERVLNLYKKRCLLLKKYPLKISKEEVKQTYFQELFMITPGY